MIANDAFISSAFTVSVNVDVRQRIYNRQEFVSIANNDKILNTTYVTVNKLVVSRRL
jgi:hypothetical protein